MNPAVYWRSALGLFWAFMFFVLLALVVGLTYLGSLAFYPYAIFLSAILLLFLTAFLLFDKRIKAGFYMCLILSALFVLNQALTLYFLFMYPTGILPSELIHKIVKDEAVFFPVVVSVLLLCWGLFLLFATWKSRPVFLAEKQQEEIAWLTQLKKTSLPELKKAVISKKQKKGS